VEIRGSTAVVTGGVSGIGQAVARALLNKGARVVVFDINKPNEEERSNSDALFVEVDVTQESSVSAGIRQSVEAFGTIDICINCAGIGSSQRTVGRTESSPCGSGTDASPST
jgi:3-hydroxyacyl-CoA dehydrogenase/3-hydroxy-2-methylbutyryl-CoA dehydrogenase